MHRSDRNLLNLESSKALTPGMGIDAHRTELCGNAGYCQESGCKVLHTTGCTQGWHRALSMVSRPDKTPYSAVHDPTSMPVIGEANICRVRKARAAPGRDILGSHRGLRHHVWPLHAMQRSGLMQQRYTGPVLVQHVRASVQDSVPHGTCQPAFSALVWCKPVCCYIKQPEGSPHVTSLRPFGCHCDLHSLSCRLWGRRQAEVYDLTCKHRLEHFRWLQLTGHWRKHKAHGSVNGWHFLLQACPHGSSSPQTLAHGQCCSAIDRPSKRDVSPAASALADSSSIVLMWHSPHVYVQMCPQARRFAQGALHISGVFWYCRAHTSTVVFAGQLQVHLGMN